MKFLTTDQMEVLMVEIAEGLTPEQSRLAPLTERQRGFWTTYARQLVQIQAAGHIVEMPQEWPDLGSYRTGYASKQMP